MKLEIIPVRIPAPPDETPEQRAIRWAEEERLSAERADRVAARFLSIVKVSKPRTFWRGLFD